MAVSESDVILELIDTTNSHLELAVFEKDIFSLKEGQRVTFKIPQLGNQELEATVTQIGKKVEGVDRTVNVYATLDAGVKNKTLVGMFVEAQLIIASREALSVPYDAVVTEESNHFILRLEESEGGVLSFKKILVETGERSGDWVEIQPIEAIGDEAKILLKGVYDLI